MAEPICIAKTEADQNSEAFQAAKAKADELGVDLKHVVPQDAVITPDRRRDPRAYAEAKKCAQVLGASVTLADPDGDANNEPPAYRDANHLETESHLFILSGKCQPREYQRLTSLARAKLKTVVPLRSWDDAPDPVRDALKATDAA